MKFGRMSVISLAVGVLALVPAATALAATVPGVPTAVSGAATAAASATISWSPPASSGSSPITGYTVGRDGFDSTGAGAYSTSVTASTTSFTMTRLVPGRTYTLSVAAASAAGSGPAASVQVALPPVPSAPTSQVLTQSGASSVAIGWAPPTTPNGTVTGYRVARDGTDSSGNGAYSTTLTATARSFTLTKLVTGSTYTITVQAINATGTGDTASGAITIKPVWAARTVPNPAGAASASLSGVSCASATACVAVGSSTTSGGVQTPLAETSSSATWTIRTVPLPAGATSGSLSGVSCASASSCVAVGSSTTAAGVTSPLAETWNGTTWTVRTVPLPTGAGNTVLNGVSCTSSTFCVAVGSYVVAQNRTGRALAESWNGTTWTVMTVADPSASDGNNGFRAVSCTASNACTAVGSYDFDSDWIVDDALAERWNGTTWSIQAITDVPLTSVSCASASACIAGGNAFDNDANTSVPVTQRWNGSTWRSTTVPDPSGVKNSSLGALSCRSSTGCTAVGSSAGSGVAYNWNGTIWTVQTPLPGSNLGPSALSCTSDTACTVTGGSTNASGQTVPFVDVR